MYFFLGFNSKHLSLLLLLHLLLYLSVLLDGCGFPPKLDDRIRWST